MLVLPSTSANTYSLPSMSVVLSYRNFLPFSRSPEQGAYDAAGGKHEPHMNQDPMRVVFSILASANSLPAMYVITHCLQCMYLIVTSFGSLVALNEELVMMLVGRDDLHMEQDSMLVDIEDHHRYGATHKFKLQIICVKGQYLLAKHYVKSLISFYWNFYQILETL